MAQSQDLGLKERCELENNLVDHALRGESAS